MIQVYQFQMDGDDVEHINRHTRFGNYLLGAKWGSRNDAVKTAAHAGRFAHVLTYSTNDLEEVFRVGNVHDESIPYTVYGRWHSISVGDVLVAPHGIYLCRSFGWERFTPEQVDQWVKVHPNSTNVLLFSC